MRNEEVEHALHESLQHSDVLQLQPRGHSRRSTSKPRAAPKPAPMQVLALEQAAANEAAAKEKRIEELHRKAAARITNQGILRGWSAWHEKWSERAKQQRQLAAIQNEDNALYPENPKDEDDPNIERCQ